MLAETPVTQRSPCYSAVSSSLTNSFLDCSNYSPFCHTHYLILRINTSLVSRARPFTKPLRWKLYLTAAALYCRIYREFMSSEEYHSALRKLNNKQRQVVMFVLLSSSSNCHLNSLLSLSLSLFSPSLSSVCSLSQSSLLLPFLIPPSLSTIPSFSSDQFSVLLR